MTTQIQRSDVQAFGDALALQRSQFEAALPSHIDPDSFIRNIMLTVQRNPDVLQADRQSIFLACQTAATDGLILDGRQATITLRWDKKLQGKRAVYIPMYQGLLIKARNSGDVGKITAQLVYEHDSFTYNPARDDVPDHEVDWFGDRGKIKGVYAVAWLKSTGAAVVEIMSKDETDKIKNDNAPRLSKGGPIVGPWADNEGEMMRKTAIRRLVKYLPMSSELAQHLDREDSQYDEWRDKDVTISSGPERRSDSGGGTRAQRLIRQKSANREVIDQPEPPESPEPAENGPVSDPTDGEGQSEPPQEEAVRKDSVAPEEECPI